MAAASKRLAHLSQYALARTVASLFHLFDAEQNMRTAACFAALFSRLGARRLVRANVNIQRAFPGMPEEEVQSLSERSVASMFQLFMVECMLTPQRLNARNWSDSVTLGTVGPHMDFLLSNKPAIFVTGHCGNWELLGFALAVLDFHLTALARPLDNPYLDEWLLGMRQRRGLGVLSKWNATEELQSIILQGGRIGFIADQNAGDDGLFVPFFGQMASSYKSIGLLAMRYRIPIFVGTAVRETNRLKYRLEIIDRINPEEWDAVEDPLFYITARFNRGIENAIRLAPEQYLWVHRRWKSRPPWERDGKPMPERVKHKLRSLPWLSPQELERLLQATPPVEARVS
ncbi:MAG: lysophospholipid acyltransferase family protein [Planctomycetes bacterium]|nr:lysophospholipid acyltransferase family protein [Planctomycetota bacterium]